MTGTLLDSIAIKTKELLPVTAALGFLGLTACMGIVSAYEQGQRIRLIKKTLLAQKPSIIIEESAYKRGRVTEYRYTSGFSSEGGPTIERIVRFGVSAPWVTIRGRSPPHLFMNTEFAMKPLNLFEEGYSPILGDYRFFRRIKKK